MSLRRKESLFRMKTVKAAFIKSLPVMAGYVILGIGFGILAWNGGYGLPWVLAMSLLVYAGSMQYVGVGLLAGGASVLTVILTTIMVNARHLFYSISMFGHYKDAGRYKPYLIFGLTDETYSLLCDGVRRDFAANSEYWKQFEGKVAEVSQKINDAYLKANDQTDGTKSYGRMVDLLLALYRAENAL